MFIVVYTIIRTIYYYDSIVILYLKQISDNYCIEICMSTRYIWMSYDIVYTYYYSNTYYYYIVSISYTQKIFNT